MEGVQGEAGIRHKGGMSGSGCYSARTHAHTRTHTVLVLPLEQFIFHAFEQAPWIREAERERERVTQRQRQRQEAAKQREVEREQQ